MHVPESPTSACQLHAEFAEARTPCSRRHERRLQTSRSLSCTAMAQVCRDDASVSRCNIPANRIISAHDVTNLFHVPGQCDSADPATHPRDFESNACSRHLRAATSHRGDERLAKARSTGCTQVEIEKSPCIRQPRETTRFVAQGRKAFATEPLSLRIALLAVFASTFQV